MRQPDSLGVPRIDSCESPVGMLTKKDAVRHPEQAQLLQEAGYRVPKKWKNAWRRRDFIGWDGEGITYDGDTAQSYVLFGCSTGDRICKPSLSTIECLDLLLAVEAAFPDAIHVGFAFQYDVNMILKDLSERHLKIIYKHNRCKWNGYRIEYRPGKWLSIRKGNVRARLFDVFGFFQSSFVSACEKFLGEDDPELVAIRAGKAARRSFTYDLLETFIVPYWEAELRLLVRLMDSLRDDLSDAGIAVNSWHGPGAVANTVFRSNNIHNCKREAPSDVNRAAQYAYAGGRFELFRCGHYPGTVWEYDINSAYPSAIAGLPNLQNGSWRHTESFVPGSFGVFYCKRDDRRTQPSALFTRPQPLFYRDKTGCVSYPSIVEGWYWTPEAALSPDSVVMGWVFDHDIEERPFAFVESMYSQRQEWKSQGNSAEKALKLALNSLYGKMAQRIGYTQETGIPKWHQLEWAGYVTSMTRANLWSALCQHPESIIAVETDAVFTTRPLDLPTGKALGQWEATEFDSLTYIQSGLYYGQQGSKTIEKYRGFDKGSLPYERVMDHLQRVDRGEKPILWGETTRFIGMGVAMNTKAVWRSWETTKRRVAVGGGGKRAHVPALCRQCKRGEPMSSSLHDLIILTAGGLSYPHELPWNIQNEPELRRQEELCKW